VINSTILGSLGNNQALVYLGDEYEVNGALWLCLFVAVFLMTPYCGFKIFTPFERLNIFMISVVKMLKRDLMIFMVLYIFFMLEFFFALYILYPRAGDVMLPQVRPFNTWYGSILSLFELAFTGSPSMIDLESDFTPLSNMQSVDFLIWLGVYLLFIILSLILLLNLLIAMLSFTFEAVRSEATLQTRTSYAQCLMRLELLADSFGMSVHVGEQKGDIFTFDFRSVESLSGGSSAGGSDPFAIPDGGPLARIEAKLEGFDEIKAKLAEMEDKMNKVVAVTPLAGI